MSYCQRQTCWQEAKVWSTTEKQGDWGTRCYAFRWKTNSNVITALPSSTSQHIHSYSTDLYHSTYCILDPTAAIQIWIPPKRFKQQIFLCFTKLWIHNIIINIIFFEIINKWTLHVFANLNIIQTFSWIYYTMVKILKLKQIQFFFQERCYNIYTCICIMLVNIFWKFLSP